MSIDRRFLGTASLVVAVALGAAACGPPPQGNQPEGTQPGATETTADVQESGGGTLVVARTGDMDNLDPHLSTAFQTIQNLELVYDALFELDPELNVQPGLASAWEYSEDGTTLTLTLREGVQFHDGDPFDSADVKASIERILDESTGAVVRTNLLSIQEVEAPDPYTVVLNLSEPDGTLPAALSSLNTAMVSDAAIEAGEVGTTPNGTGPFVFENWTQGQSLTLTANQDYWGEGPFVDGVEIRVVPEEASILAGLRAGEFHFAVLGDPAVISQVEEDLTVEKTPELGYFPFFLNSERPPLDNKQVRQAIACAIDRQQVIDTAILGEGQPTGPFVIPAYASDPYQGLPCDGPDPDMARQLLTEAGFGDGFSIETIVITGENTAAAKVGQSLQAQLAEIGVNLRLQQLETNIYVDRWLAADFDSALSQNGAGPDPHHTYAKYFTSTGNFHDVAKYSSEELDQLFAAGKAETDPEARKEIYAQISELLLEASPWAWLYTGFRYQVMQPEVTGFVPLPTGSIKALRQVKLQQ